MADYKRFPSASIQLLLPKRRHKDKFLTEIAMVSGKSQMDIGEFVVEDIKHGNTFRIGQIYKAASKKFPEFGVTLVDGSVGGDTGYRVIPRANHTIMGACPIQDDYSLRHGGGGYLDVADGDSQKKDVERFLKNGYNVRLEDLDEGILNPNDIPPVLNPDGTPNGDFRGYKKMWEADDELQQEFPTLDAYRNDLVSNLTEQREGSKDISDVYVTTGVMASELDDTNVVALYYTMENLLPQLTWHPGAKKKKDFPAQNYIFEYSSGYFAMVGGMSDWSHIIRTGIVENDFEKPGYRNKKSFHKIYTGKDTNRENNTGDPISYIVKGKSISHIGGSCLEIKVQITETTYGEIRIWDYGTLHSITGRDGVWSGVYGSIREGIGSGNDYEDSWSPDIPKEDQTVSADDGATYITTIQPVTQPALIGDKFRINQEYGDYADFTIDPQNGFVNAVTPLNYSAKKTYYIKVLSRGVVPSFSKMIMLKIEVNNINGAPEPPTDPGKPDDDEEFNEGLAKVFFPLEYKAMKKVPLFKRERLLRETTCVMLYAVKKIKLKWYEKTIFKVIFFIIALIFALWTGGQSITLYLVITTAVELVITALIVNLIGQMIAKLIDAPWLLALVALVIGLYGSWDQAASLMQQAFTVATQVMNAVNTYKIATVEKELAEIKSAYEDFMNDLKKSGKELEALMEEAGTMSTEYGAAAALKLARLATIETPEDMFNRTLNLDSALQNDMSSTLDLDASLKLF